jgi:hypothetical protein
MQDLRAIAAKCTVVVAIIQRRRLHGRQLECPTPSNMHVPTVISRQLNIKERVIAEALAIFGHRFACVDAASNCVVGNVERRQRVTLDNCMYPYCFL